MQPITQLVPISKKRLWAGRILSGLIVTFLLVDGVMKLMKSRVAVEGTIQLGYPESVIVWLGIVLLACTLLYAIPRTSILGGAVATHVRVGDPLFSHAFFPVYLGVLLWGGLLLRDNRLRALIVSNN